jgi:hypothetical protein
LPQDFDFAQNHELHLSPEDMQHFSLKDAYMTFDMRNSYLQRQANSLAGKADSIVITKDAYETKSCNVWRSPDSSSIYESSTALDFYTGQSSAEKVINTLTFQLDYLNKYT